MSKFHLKGLDSYRAIAALIVLIGHIELFKNEYGISFNWYNTQFIKYTGGHIAVVLFFALSGFLISMLLLKEKDKYNDVSIRKFYMRRIFRVWPLYYFVILVSYILIGFSPGSLTFILCLTIFPNIGHAIGAGWSVSPQIWSIGVEEQFYLAWPWIAKKAKNLLIVSGVIFIVITILPHATLFVATKFNTSADTLKTITKIFAATKFNCMAMGGIVAALYHQKSKIVKILNKNNIISYGLIVLPFILWFSGFHIKYFTDEMYAVLFSISILNISTNPAIIDIDFKIPAYLGKISYGIYMYHWIVLELLFRTDIITIKNNLLFNILIYVLAISGTILLSTISYYYFERIFLRIKDKYSRL